jgi:hypothetical protein
MLAMSAFIAPAFIAPSAFGHATSLDSILATVPAEQAEAYQLAVEVGPDALVAFMDRYPTSRLNSAVITALAKLIGVERAIQIALDAGVPTEVVFAVAADLSAPITTITGQAPANAVTPY